jgi:hypothetical protein
VPIVLKNSVFQSDVLKPENFGTHSNLKLLFAQQILKNDTLRDVLLVRIALNLSARSFSTE